MVVRSDIDATVRAIRSMLVAVLSMALVGCHMAAESAAPTTENPPTASVSPSPETSAAADRPTPVRDDAASLTIPAKALHEDAVPRKARGEVTVDLLTAREIGRVIPSPYIGIPDYQARGRFFGLRWRLHNNTNRAVVPAVAFAYQLAVTDGHDFWSVWTHADQYPNNAPSIIGAYNYNEGEGDPEEPIVPGRSATMWAVFQVPTAVRPVGLLVDIDGLRQRPPISLPPTDGPQPSEPGVPEVPDPEPPAAAYPGAAIGDAGDCPLATDQPAWVVFDGMTDTWQITICRTLDDRYLYHGAAHADSSRAITLPATATGPHHYEATNRSYRYVVTPETLTVWQDAELLVEESFLPGE